MCKRDSKIIEIIICLLQLQFFNLVLLTWYIKGVMTEINYEAGAQMTTGYVELCLGTLITQKTEKFEFTFLSGPE